MKRSIHIVILTFTFNSFFFIHSSAQFTSIWNQVSYPSLSNAANAITTNSSGVYVAGFDIYPGNKQFRLEKRDLNTGTPVSGFGVAGVITSNPTTNDDQANGIAIDTSGVYITGSQDMCLGCNAKWRIEKRNLTTGTTIWSQISDPSVNPDGSNAITVDSSGVYVAGTVGISFLNWAWRVEKRNVLTGDTIWTRTIDATFLGDSPLAITSDVTGVYIAGAVFDTTAGTGDKWRIEKRDLTTGNIIWAQSGNGERAQGMAIDSSAIYVVGDGFLSATDYNWRIEKRSLTSGTLIPSFGTGGVVLSNPGAGADNATAVSTGKYGIYIAGTDENSGNEQWRMEERDPVSGALTCTTINNPSANTDRAYAITTDTSGIYMTGTDLITANEEWRIEKYNYICNDSTTSIDNIPTEKNELLVYPNPFSFTTTLQSHYLLQDATIIIYNSFGEVIKQLTHISGKTVLLSRDHLPAGIYFIQLTQNNRVFTTNKLIVTD